MIDLDSDDLLTVSQMAELLYIPVRAVLKLIDEEKSLPVMRIGGYWRIERESFLTWGELAYSRWNS